MLTNVAVRVTALANGQVRLTVCADDTGGAMQGKRTIVLAKHIDRSLVRETLIESGFEHQANEWTRLTQGRMMDTLREVTRELA